jgi:hypothetical protein
MRRILALAVLATLSACSSPDRAGAPGAPASPPGDVQLSIVNRTGSTLSVFLVWNGGRSRLGEIGSGRTREFNTPFRATEIALGVDVAAVPPSGTSDAPRGFNATTGAREPNMLVSGAVPVDAGDIILFEIRSLTPRLNVYWREVLP